MIAHHYIPDRLRGIVDLIWEQRSETPTQWRILPSGKVEWLFRLGVAPRMLSARRISELNTPLKHFSFLSGLHTGPLDLAYEKFHYIGVQMQPVAAKALFGIPLFKVRDYYLEAEGLIPNLHEIQDRLNAEVPFEQKARWLEDEMLLMIRETAELHQAINLSQFNTKIVAANAPSQRQASVAQFLGYSRTHTFRIFKDWFGVSCGYYQRLLRFVHAVQHMHVRPAQLTRTGLDLGYFDQSHFIRDFREFSGMTPGTYKEKMTSLPGQLPL